MRSPRADIENDESKALLSSEDSQNSGQLDTTIVEASQSNTWRRILLYCVSVVVILTTAAFATTHLFRPTINTHPNLSFHGSELRSNGTHDFKRTVLMVSIDGLRCVHRH